MENSTKILIGGVVVVTLGAILYSRCKDSKIVSANATCFDLPSDVDPVKFGPSYWAAFHALAHKVPCGGCRTFAEKFMIYFHDMVNKKLSKPIYDQANFDYFNNAIARLNSGTDFNTAFSFS